MAVAFQQVFWLFLYFSHFPLYLWSFYYDFQNLGDIKIKFPVVLSIQYVIFFDRQSDFFSKNVLDSILNHDFMCFATQYLWLLSFLFFYCKVNKLPFPKQLKMLHQCFSLQHSLFGKVVPVLKNKYVKSCLITERKYLEVLNYPVKSKKK